MSDAAAVTSAPRNVTIVRIKRRREEESVDTLVLVQPSAKRPSTEVEVAKTPAIAGDETKLIFTKVAEVRACETGSTGMKTKIESMQRWRNLFGGGGSSDGNTSGKVLSSVAAKTAQRKIAKGARSKAARFNRCDAGRVDDFMTEDGLRFYDVTRQEGIAKDPKSPHSEITCNDKPLERRISKVRLDEYGFRVRDQPGGEVTTATTVAAATAAPHHTQAKAEDMSESEYVYDMYYHFRDAGFPADAPELPENLGELEFEEFLVDGADDSEHEGPMNDYDSNAEDNPDCDYPDELSSNESAGDDDEFYSRESNSYGYTKRQDYSDSWSDGDYKDADEDEGRNYGDYDADAIFD